MHTTIALLANSPPTSARPRLYICALSHSHSTAHTPLRQAPRSQRRAVSHTGLHACVIALRAPLGTGHIRPYGSAGFTMLRAWGRARRGLVRGGAYLGCFGVEAGDHSAEGRGVRGGDWSGAGSVSAARAGVDAGFPTGGMGETRERGWRGRVEAIFLGVEMGRMAAWWVVGGGEGIGAWVRVCGGVSSQVLVGRSDDGSGGTWEGGF